MRIRLNVANEEDFEYNDDVGLLSILEKQLKTLIFVLIDLLWGLLN